MSAQGGAGGPDGPAVSIVVPVYNRAGRLLDEALESILGQDHRPLEVVAIDDGSTDSTPEALAAWAERHPDRFRWAGQENGGQAAALNHGFELAAGELVGYLSSDDLLLPGAISELAAALEDNPDAVLAYPDYLEVDGAGETTDRVHPPAYSRPESVRLQDTIVGPGGLFRASALRAAGPVRTDLRFLPDMELWLRLGLEGPFVHVERPLAAWRRHADSLSGADRGRAMADERLRLLDEVYGGPGADELEPVRGEAYRNALVLAASVVADGLNSPGERYFVVDRHAREISERAGEQGTEERLAEARDRNRTQLERMRRLERELEIARDRPLVGVLRARVTRLLAGLRRRARRGP